MDFKQIINLAKQTGDRVIIFNPVDNSSWVVMDISEYEKLILAKSDVQGLTEEDLVKKINRDVALWRANQNDNLAHFSDFAAQDKLPIDGLENANLNTLDNFSNFGTIDNDNNSKNSSDFEAEFDNSDSDIAKEEEKFYYLNL